MDLISHQTRKARKEHTCDWCLGKIKKGQHYNHSFCKDDYVFVWKNHIRCAEIATELKMFDDGGVTQDDFHEHIGEEYMRIMSEHHNEIYEAKDFKYPSFEKLLDFVCEFHNINTNQNEPK